MQNGNRPPPCGLSLGLNWGRVCVISRDGEMCRTLCLGPSRAPKHDSHAIFCFPPPPSFGDLGFPSYKTPRGPPALTCFHVASDLPWKGQSPIWASVSTSVRPCYWTSWAARPHRSPRPPPAEFPKHSHRQQRYRPVVQMWSLAMDPSSAALRGRGSPRLVHPLT